MRRARRRIVGVSRWEQDREQEVEAARLAEELRRQDYRAGLIKRAAATAKKHGATGHWRAYWRLVGLSDAELDEVSVDITLGE